MDKNHGSDVATEMKRFRTLQITRIERGRRSYKRGIVTKRLMPSLYPLRMSKRLRKSHHNKHPEARQRQSESREEGKKRRDVFHGSQGRG